MPSTPQPSTEAVAEALPTSTSTSTSTPSLAVAAAHPNHTKRAGSAEVLPDPHHLHSHHHPRLQLVTSRSEGNLSGVHPSQRQVQEASPSLFIHPDPNARAFPYQPLTDEQQTKYDACLAHFTTTTQYPDQLQAPKGKPMPTSPPSDWEKMRLLTRESILRYLRACKWDVDDSKKALTATIAFRREFGADQISTD